MRSIGGMLDDKDAVKIKEWLTENIMHELWIYLCKAGWRVEYYKDFDNELIKHLKIYF